MALFLDRESPPRFWNLTTFLFALGGLFAYLVSLWLFETKSALVLVLVSMVRLMLGVGPASLMARTRGWRPAGSLYSLAWAFPYPFELALFAYRRRFQFLPRNLLISLSGPTTFLIFLASALLASRWTTTWALPAGVKDNEAERLRLLGGSLFVLTAIGVLTPGSWSLWFLHYVSEPVALMGYCAIVGHAERQPAPE